LRDLEVIGGDMSVILEGADGMRISCTQKKYQASFPFNFARGQRLVVEGKCVGAVGESVSFNECLISGSEKDPAVSVEAAALVTAYRTDTSGDAMYKGKQLRISKAVIEKFDADGIMIAVPSGKKANTKKIRVEYDPKYRDIPITPPFRVGGSVTIRGQCAGVTDDEIVITGGWFLH
jgi:hypothetical protein